MSVLAKLASAIGRKDEQPNIHLAEAIVKKKDAIAVKELVTALNGRDKAIRSDAIKCLYEVGEREPGLIAAHLDAFVVLLGTKDNRMVWGAMCAIDAITGERPGAVHALLPKIMAAVDVGSVITRDHAVKALVKLASEKKYRSTALPLLLEQLRIAPVNQLPSYAELVSSVVEPGNASAVVMILSKRLGSLPTPAKRKRVEKVLKQLTGA